MIKNKREKMRVSADREDKGFRFDHHKFEAFLNDKIVPYCITADEEEGLVICAVVDEQGAVQKTKDQEVMTVTKYGQVEIRVNPHVD